MTFRVLMACLFVVSLASGAMASTMADVDGGLAHMHYYADFAGTTGFETDPWVGFVGNDGSNIEQKASDIRISFGGMWGISPQTGALAYNFGVTPTINFLDGANALGLSYFPTGGTIQAKMGSDVSDKNIQLTGFATLESVAGDLVSFSLSGDLSDFINGVAPSFFFSVMDDMTGSLVSVESLTFSGDFGTSHQLFEMTYNPTPIPGSVILLLSGLAGMVGIRRLTAFTS